MGSLLASENNLALCSEEDALNTIVSGLTGCVFTTNELSSEFFDLSTGVAGAAFQKFVNYQFPVAIILPENHNYGIRVTELVRDHRSHPYVRFYNTIDEANKWLCGKCRKTSC